LGIYLATFLALFQRGGKDREARMSVTRLHVRQMLDTIEKSYTERITLDTFAQMLNRQSAYLGHVFRQEVGMTVHQWVTRVRLDHAAMLIRQGVKIEAVSLIVGYKSKKNFYRQFRRYFATTPHQYRAGSNM
jgi:two-component system, response regulator YesN